MKYKMVVMDIDDTLIKDDKTISTAVKNAIEKAQKMGVKVVLASGRPTFAMRKLEKELELDKYGSYIISFNGAVVTESAGDRDIFKIPVKMMDAHELYDVSKEYGLFIQTYLGDNIVTEENNAFTEIEAEITGMEIKIVDDFKKSVDRDVIKLIMLEEPEKLKKAGEEIAKRFTGRFSVAISKPFFLEFTDNGIDKASAIDFLVKREGITKEEVIAIGDSYNDLSMIKYAGLGVCMANGKEDVKKESDYIAPSNEEDGVAHVFEKFIFNN